MEGFVDLDQAQALFNKSMSTLRRASKKEGVRKEYKDSKLYLSVDDLQKLFDIRLNDNQESREVVATAIETVSPQQEAEVVELTTELEKAKVELSYKDKEIETLENQIVDLKERIKGLDSETRAKDDYFKTLVERHESREYESRKMFSDLINAEKQEKSELQLFILDLKKEKEELQLQLTAESENEEEVESKSWWRLFG